MSTRFFPLCALVAFATLPSVQAADAAAPAETFAPRMPDIERYQAIWKRSPFIVETVAVQVSLGLAAKYSLVGIASLGAQPMVFLVDKTNPDPVKGRLLVSKAQSSKDGIELVSVAINSDPRKSTAIIRQAGQQATLPLDTSALPVAGTPPGAVPVARTISPPGGGLIPPPSLPTSVPTINPPTPANPGVPTPPPSPRRIIRPGPPINVN